ncbi:hypothetical protein ILYODFUR_035534 [Ilyodon furcidens]|uniref:Uncharacterized protein n=1 Tax=Ilyodon furcidens TaxID=33524 RepID=A0ABV0V8S2_9TELE
MTERIRGSIIQGSFASSQQRELTEVVLVSNQDASQGLPFQGFLSFSHCEETPNFLKRPYVSFRLGMPWDPTTVWSYER